MLKQQAPPKQRHTCLPTGPFKDMNLFDFVFLFEITQTS